MTITGAQSHPMAGGPQPWEPGSVNNKAADEVAKSNLGIVPQDTLQVFTQINQKTVWKYDVGPDNPMLRGPNIQVRLSEDPGEGPSREWNTYYKQLIDSLPDDVKAELLQQQEELYTNRNPRYEALDRSLEIAAKVIQHLHSVDHPVSPESAEALYQLFNYALPGIALNGSMEISQEIIHYTDRLLSSLSSQSESYDQNLADLAGLQTGQAQLYAIAEQLIASPPGSDPRATIRALANDQGALSGGGQLAGEEGGMAILQGALSAIQMVSMAAALEVGSPPLLIGLTAAAKDATAPREMGGFIGPGLQQLLEGFNGAINSSYGESDRPGGEAVLSSSLTVLASLVLGSAGLIAERGIAPLPVETAVEKRQARQFSAELLLQLLVGSGTFDQLSEILVSTGEIPFEAAPTAAKGLTLATLLMIAYAASLSGNDAREEVLSSLQPQLATLFESLSQDVESRRLTDRSDPLTLFLQQGLMATQEGNFSALVAAMDLGLNNVGISPQQLRRDISFLRDVAASVQQSVTEGLDDKTDTGTTIQFVTA